MSKSKYYLLMDELYNSDLSLNEFAKLKNVSLYSLKEWYYKFAPLYGFEFDYAARHLRVIEAKKKANRKGGWSHIKVIKKSQPSLFDSTYKGLVETIIKVIKDYGIELK